MEEKPKKTIRKSTIFIFILLAVLIGSVFYIYRYYQKRTEEIAKLNESVAALEPDTVKVERGDLRNTLDDLTGTIRPNQSVSLYWQISGTVAEVNVEVGDKVSKGDVLAVLDRSTIDSSVIDAIVSKEEAEESLARLYTSTLTLEQKRSAMVEAKKSLNDAQDALNALGAVRENNIEIGVKYDDYMRAVDNYNNALETYESVKYLDLDNPVRQRATSNVQNAKSRMDSAKAQYNWYSGETDELEVQQADANLKLAEAKYADAERAYNRIKDGPTENQVKSLQAQIDSAQAIINNGQIVSPINGTVAVVDAKPFDVITYESSASTRNILAVRVDDLSSYYIDLSISEKYINQISLGQEVLISFDAIPLQEYTGTVVNISSAGVASGLSVSFPVTVKVDDPDRKIKSGMMADIEIVLESAEDCLIVPQKALQRSSSGNGQVVIRVNPDDTETEIPVRVGLSSGSDVQVSSDTLKEGDSVKVTKVTPILTSSRGGLSGLFGVGGGMGGPGGGGRPGGGMGGPGGGMGGPGGGGRP